MLSRPLVLPALLAALLLLPARQAHPSDSSQAKPHAYFRQPGQCPRCHIGSGTDFVPVRISLDSVEFCLECHRFEEQGVTHPMKVRPRDRFRGIVVPPDYVLSVDGKIICVTCHTAHGTDGNHFLRRSGRGASGNTALCNGCHKSP